MECSTEVLSSKAPSAVVDGLAASAVAASRCACRICPASRHRCAATACLVPAACTKLRHAEAAALPAAAAAFTAASSCCWLHACGQSGTRPGGCPGRAATTSGSHRPAASLRLQLAVELEDAEAGAHAAQLAHKLDKLLDAARLVRQQVALCNGRGSIPRAGGRWNQQRVGRAHSSAP